MNTVCIIGGGASGLVAAIVAARNGVDVTLIDRQSRLGKKILVTGNGRCNITNEVVKECHFHTHSNKNPFEVIEQFDDKKTMDFFRELGIVPFIEKGKVYPSSEQASSVLDVLRFELTKLNIKIIVEQKIDYVKSCKKGFEVINSVGEKWFFEKVILATGGMAAPQLGCDDTGYKIAKSLGHNIHPAFPTLVHITSPTSYCKMMQGIRVKGVTSIWVNNKKQREENGEVLFTEDGLSGPPIFQLSRIAAESCNMGKKCEIKIDLFPKQTEEDLISMFYERIAQNMDKTIEEIFVGWLHKKVVIPVIKQAAVGSPVAPSANLEYDMLVELAKAMKNLKFEVTGTRGFKFAQATAGGVAIDEIDLKTMESVKHKGLYLIGELLDVDGDCGGYNLQWAWSTGFLAGLSVAK
ncbi:MAG: NAD(P)/FAD-dependent oxidoreductase [Cellulosilyticaceae bacterium]